MLIIALVLAVIGLAALVTAVVTSNEFIAWVCIAASVLGVLLLIIDAIRERQRREALGEDAEAGGAAAAADAGTAEDTYQTFDADYPEDGDETTPAVEAPDQSAATEPVEGSDAVEVVGEAEDETGVAEGSGDVEVVGEAEDEADVVDGAVDSAVTEDADDVEDADAQDPETPDTEGDEVEKPS